MLIQNERQYRGSYRDCPPSVFVPLSSAKMEACHPFREGQYKTRGASVLVTALTQSSGTSKERVAMLQNPAVLLVDIATSVLDAGRVRIDRARSFIRWWEGRQSWWLMLNNLFRLSVPRNGDEKKKKGRQSWWLMLNNLFRLSFPRNGDEIYTHGGPDGVRPRVHLINACIAGSHRSSGAGRSNGGEGTCQELISNQDQAYSMLVRLQEMAATRDTKDGSMKRTSSDRTSYDARF